MLGRGHEFMHEREREGMLAILGSGRMARLGEEATEMSVETCRDGVETLI